MAILLQHSLNTGLPYHGQVTNIGGFTWVSNPTTGPVDTSFYPWTITHSFWSDHRVGSGFGRYLDITTGLRLHPFEGCHLYWYFGPILVKYENNSKLVIMSNSNTTLIADNLTPCGYWGNTVRFVLSPGSVAYYLDGVLQGTYNHSIIDTGPTIDNWIHSGSRSAFNGITISGDPPVTPSLPFDRKFPRPLLNF